MNTDETGKATWVEGLALIGGAAVTLVCNVAFPRSDNPAVVEQVLTTLGQQEHSARVLSLGLAVGIWLILGGMTGVYRTVTNGMAGIWIRTGFYLLVVTVAVWTVTFGLLLALADAAAQWVTAPMDEAATRFAVAETLYIAFSSLYTIAIVAEALAVMVIGAGLSLNSRFGLSLGLVGAVLGALTLLAVGVPRAVEGPTETDQAIFLIVSSLTLLWFFFLSVWLLTHHLYSDR